MKLIVVFSVFFSFILEDINGRTVNPLRRRKLADKILIKQLFLPAIEQLSNHGTESTRGEQTKLSMRLNTEREKVFRCKENRNKISVSIT